MCRHETRNVVTPLNRRKHWYFATWTEVKGTKPSWLAILVTLHALSTGGSFHEWGLELKAIRFSKARGYALRRPLTKWLHLGAEPSRGWLADKAPKSPPLQCWCGRCAVCNVGVTLTLTAVHEGLQTDPHQLVRSEMIVPEARILRS